MDTTPSNISLAPRFNVISHLPILQTLYPVPQRDSIESDIKVLLDADDVCSSVISVLGRIGIGSLQPRATIDLSKIPKGPIIDALTNANPGLFKYDGLKYPLRPLKQMVKRDELSVQEHMLPCSTGRLSVQNETMYKDESLENKVKVKSKKKRAASSEIVVDEPWHKGPPEEETARLVKCIQGLIFPSQQSIHPDVDLKQDLSAITQHQVLNLLEDEVLNGHHQDAHIGQRLAESSTTINTIMNVTPVLSLSGLNHLCSELLLPAKASGLLPNLPLDILKHMLLALRIHMAPGSECSLDYNSSPDEVALVQSALDAAMAALYVLSCPGMPSELYLEEMIEQIILVIKHNLQHNVMVFYESRFARLWRPSLLPEGSAYRSSEKKSAHIKKSMSKGGRSSNYDASSAFYTTTDQQGALPHVLPMLQRLEQATSLLSETLGQARLEAYMLLPLVRVALQTLTVESLKVYQVKAVGLTVAVFKHVPSLRQVIMDELISSLVPSLLPVGANKAPKRLFLVEGQDGDQSGRSSSVQMIVSLVTQLVQDVAEMPASDCGAKATYERCGLPIAWADRFWTGIMDRLPAAKASKADTSSDLKAFLEDFINDLFVLHHLPDWPAAALLLRRLVVQLNTHRGLKHSEASVKLMSIDFLGAVAAKLIAEYQIAEGDEGDVERMWRRAKTEMARRREGSRTELSPEGSDREDDAVALSSPGANLPPERSIQHEVISPLKSQGCHDILQQLLIHHVRMHGQGSAPYRLAHSSRGVLLGGGSAAGGAGRKGHWEHAGNLRAVLMLRDKLVEEARMVSSESDADAADKQSNADHKPGQQQQQQHKGLDGISQERAMELNLEHRMLLDPGLGEGLISTSVLPDISRREAVMLGRWLVANGALGKARGTLLKWLVDAGDKSSQDGSAANVRAKAVKSIGAAIEVDVRILSLADVQGAVRDALQDDSVMVREAAIDLIGRYISRNKDLGVDYFDLIKGASMDQGLSVRKRAIKVLWDCCVLCPGGFPRLDEAVMIILHRVGDNEESMRKLAQNLCCQLWFSSDHELITQDTTSTIAAFPSVPGGTHPSSSSDDRSPLSRAKQLASVCYAVHLAEGGLPHTPPSPDNAVLMLLRGVLGRDGISNRTAITPAAAAVQATTRESAEAVVKALMAWYLQLHDAVVLDPGPAHQAQLTALMALHALASADVSVCLPRKDPPAHIKCLAPYLKERPTEGSSEDAKRCCAGRLLYINSFISLASKGLDVLDASLSEVIAHDLQDMITRHQFVGVVNSACQCLCVLARLNSATLAPKVHEVLARHYRQLDRDYQAGCTSSSKWKPFYSRWLLVMGQLCRHGASLIDQVAEQLLLRQQQQLEMQNSSTSMGLSSFSGAAGSTLEPSHSYSGVTSLMASGSGSSSTVLLPAVGSSQCMTLFLRYLDLADDHEGLLDGSSKAARVMGGSVKLCDSAMQALGLLFISKPDLMLADSAVMSVMETALEASSTIGQSSGMSTASTLSLQCLSAGGGSSARALTGTVSENMSRCLRRDALKRRVLGNLVEMLRAEEDLMEERQAKAVQEHANSQLASTLPASDDHGEGHRPLARINGEGDASSLTSSVVQKLWPKILALARDVPPAATSGAASKQGGTRAPPHGDVYADAAGLALKGDRGAAVRRKVVDLIEVVQRGGLTAPWQCVAPLVALSSDLNSDTAAKALKLLKQCVDKHADYVGSELSPGIMHSYMLQRKLYEAEHGAGSFGKSDDLPEEAGHHLVAMWSSVIQPHASLKNKMLTALMRPFEDASNTAGPGALTSDPGLLWYSTWLSSRLAYRRMDEPLSLLSTLSGVLARRSEAVLTELKDALEEQKKLRGSSSSSRRVDAPGGDGAAAAAASTAVSDSAVAMEDVMATLGGGMGAVPGGSVEVLPCGESVDAVPYDVGAIQGLMAARDSFLRTPSGGPTAPGVRYGLEDNAAANSPGEGHHGAPDKVLAGQGCESSVCVLDCSLPAVQEAGAASLPAVQEAGAASAVIVTAAAHEKQATAVLSSSASITASTSLQAAAAATSTAFQVADASFARASSVHHTPTGARSAALPFTPLHHQFISSPSFNQLTPQVSGSLSYNSASVSMAVNVSAAAVAAASVPGMTSRLVGAVKASAALSLLLLLKQYLFRAYRLTEERVAGLTGNAQGRKNEAKVSAVRDLRVPHPRLHVIDLEAHQDVSLKGAKEQYKTLKYLLSEDVHLCGSSVLNNSDNGIEADSRGRPEMMLANETKKTPVSATRSSKQGYAGGKPPKSTTKSKFGQGSTAIGTKGRLVLKGKRGKRRRSSSYEEDDTSEEGVDNDGTQAAQLGEREAIHANEECSRSVRKKTGGSRKTRSEASSVGNLEEDMEG